MKQQNILLPILTLLCIFACYGCKSELHEFSLSYSFENINNYKVQITINSDKQFRIEKHNYFMDNHEGKRRPIIIEGTLSDTDYSTIKKEIENARLFKMKDSYGFDHEAKDNTEDILYQISLDADTKHKSVTFRDNEGVKLPSSFIQLTQQLNNFIKTYEQN